MAVGTCLPHGYVGSSCYYKTLLCLPAETFGVLISLFVFSNGGPLRREVASRNPFLQKWVILYHIGIELHTRIGHNLHTLESFQ